MSGGSVRLVADDLGASRSKTDAIVGAALSGDIDYCSIMATGDYLAQAADAARVGGFADRVGAHLVLSAHAPLTDGIKRCRRFCDEAEKFYEWRGRFPILRLSRGEERCVYEELTAQLGAIRSVGLNPSHIDSHHHVHNELPVLRICISLAREWNIPAIRLGRNFGSGRSVGHRSYKRLINGFINLAGLARSDYFGSIPDYIALSEKQRSGSSYELVVHPVMSPRGVIVDADAMSVPLAATARKLRLLGGVDEDVRRQPGNFEGSYDLFVQRGHQKDRE